MITFTQSGSEKEIDFEYALKKIEQIEAKHKLQVIDGRFIATIGFVQDIAKTFGLTSTAAFFLWTSCYSISERLRIIHADMAKVAYWYKIDPYQLSQQRRHGLLMNLPVVQAQQRVADGNFEATNYEHIYELVKLATGDEAKARKARTASLERYVDQQTGFK